MSLVNYEDIYEEFLTLSSPCPEKSSNSGNKVKSGIKIVPPATVITKIASDPPAPIRTGSPKRTLLTSPINSPTLINFSVLKMGGEDGSIAVSTVTQASEDRVDGHVEPPQNSVLICDRMEDRQNYGEKRPDPPSSSTPVSSHCASGSPPMKRVAIGMTPTVGHPNVSNNNNYQCQANQNNMTDAVTESQFQMRSSNVNGLFNGIEGQLGNRQQSPYYPYPTDFQYPSPHFLTGGYIQPTSLLSPHMQHYTGWNLGQGQNHQIGDHNYIGQSPQQSSQNNNLQQPQQQYNGIAQQFQLPPYQSPTSSCQSSLQGPSSSSPSISNHILANNRSSWTLNGESIYPGGLEVLWREVPEECQKLMTIQDVPDTAKFRGYFTVCELIALKRSLVARLTCNPSSNSKAGHGEIITSNEVGVGLAVKEAMNALHADPQISEHDNIKTEYCEMNGHSTGSANGCSASVSSGTGPSVTVTTVGNLDPNQQVGPSGTNIGPPPPYRTATLVFKLLQIGNYQFRSFSEVNPNRLRVLFNTQRLTYECQLSVVRPPRDGMQPLRKLLTVDIGFDQIRVIRFGPDKLFLKVEGAPLLTVTYNPANEDSTCPQLSQQDYQLLEQIDKGQLKLSPCHQLYFLNERLVHLLEAQFREHPRFRHIVQNTFHHHPPQSQFLPMQQSVLTSSTSS